MMVDGSSREDVGRSMITYMEETYMYIHKVIVNVGRSREAKVKEKKKLF
jgi:hypothetical protein